MEISTWRVVIVDMPHREDLFAEVWIENEQLAEVFVKDGNPTIEIYPNPAMMIWRLNYEDLLAIVQKINQFLDSIEK